MNFFRIFVPAAVAGFAAGFLIGVGTFVWCAYNF